MGFRPRWTFTSEGGNVWAIYEPEFQTGDTIFGATANRIPVGVNRWLADFLIPGTQLRARFGKTDWTDPSGEFFDPVGRSRLEG